jgi:uncharacterized protein YndB with AHSA1/START domain
MPTIERSILVDAPVEEVFQFVADYRNTTRYQHQFSRFEPIGTITRGLGLTVDARGRFKGIPIHAKLRITEFVENERIVSESIEGLKSEAAWTFAPEGDQTRVTFRGRYAWPIPILSGALRRTLMAELVAMTESSLRELKLLVERRRREATSEGSAE